MNEALLFLTIFLSILTSLWMLRLLLAAYIASMAKYKIMAFIAEPSRDSLDAADKYLTTWSIERKSIEPVVWRRFNQMRQSFERREVLSTKFLDAIHPKT